MPEINLVNIYLADRHKYTLITANIVASCLSWMLVAIKGNLLHNMLSSLKLLLYNYYEK